jgi:acetyl-CoA carboxylase biotin carboxyl carrier protein
MSKVPARDVEALVELFERSDWSELHLELGQFRLDLSKHGAVNAPQRQPLPTAPPSTTQVIPIPREPPPKVPADVAPEGVASARERRIPEGWVAVRAPNLGTFYRSPKPGAPPYVDVGQEISAGSEICLLEVMKLFTTVVAREGGVVREICVADGAMIERDQLLVLIEPKI